MIRYKSILRLSIRMKMVVLSVLFFLVVNVSGCTSIVKANFNQSSFTVGSSPQGEFTGSPQGDIIISYDNVSIAAASGKMSTKHLRIGPSPAAAIITAAQHPDEPSDYWINFDGLRTSGDTYVDVWDTTDINNPINPFSITIYDSVNSPQPETRLAIVWLANNGQLTSTPIAAGPVDALHHVLIRFDRLNSTINIQVNIFESENNTEIFQESYPYGGPSISRITEIRVRSLENANTASYQIDNLTLKYKL